MMLRAEKKEGTTGRVESQLETRRGETECLFLHSLPDPLTVRQRVRERGESGTKRVGNKSKKETSEVKGEEEGKRVHICIRR